MNDPIIFGLAFFWNGFHVFWCFDFMGGSHYSWVHEKEEDSVSES